MQFKNKPTENRLKELTSTVHKMSMLYVFTKIQLKREKAQIAGTTQGACDHGYKITGLLKPYSISLGTQKPAVCALHIYV